MIISPKKLNLKILREMFVFLKRSFQESACIKDSLDGCSLTPWVDLQYHCDICCEIRREEKD